MRICLSLITLALMVSAGCGTPGGGGGGNDGPPSGEDDNFNSNGGGGPSVENDNQTVEDDDADGPNDNAADAGENDNGDDSGELPTAFRLDGVWDDNGRHAIVEQNGVEVEATYFSEYICDLDTGPVPVDEEPAPGADTESTFFDFGGTLNNGEGVLPGDVITGQTSICLYGSTRGIVLADFTLNVVDEDALSGEWEYDSDGDGEPDYAGSITLTREQ